MVDSGYQIGLLLKQERAAQEEAERKAAEEAEIAQEKRASERRKQLIEATNENTVKNFNEDGSKWLSSKSFKIDDSSEDYIVNTMTLRKAYTASNLKALWGANEDVDEENYVNAADRAHDLGKNYLDVWKTSDGITYRIYYGYSANASDESRKATKAKVEALKKEAKNYARKHAQKFLKKFAKNWKEKNSSWVGSYEWDVIDGKLHIYFYTKWYTSTSSRSALEDEQMHRNRRKLAEWISCCTGYDVVLKVLDLDKTPAAGEKKAYKAKYSDWFVAPWE